MKTQFVIECDTDYCTISVHEVTKKITGDGVEYGREVCNPIFSDFIGPRFYGKLDTLLISRERIKEAPPITPQMPIEAAKEGVSQ